jgi:hypothetical protein
MRQNPIDLLSISQTGNETVHVRTNPRIDEILFEETSHKRIIFQAFSREECTVNCITTRLWFIFVTEYDGPGSAFDAYTLDSNLGRCTIRADDNVRTIFLPRIKDHAWFVVVISLNADSHANIGAHPLSMVKHEPMINLRFSPSPKLLKYPRCPIILEAASSFMPVGWDRIT